MIFVTVGTDTHQLNRLLKELDRLKGNKILKDEVIAQIGNCTYKPRNYKNFNFTTLKHFNELNKKANIIISHGGAGSLIQAFQYHKTLIVVPRTKKYDEHTDDHQIQIAKELERQGKIIAVYNIKNLMDAIRKSKNFKIITSRKSNKISQIIIEYISDLEAND